MFPKSSSKWTNLAEACVSGDMVSIKCLIGHLANIATPDAFPRKDGWRSDLSTRSGSGVAHLDRNPRVRMAAENWRCTLCVAAVSLAEMKSRPCFWISCWYCCALETIEVGFVMAHVIDKSGPGLAASPTLMAVKGLCVALVFGKMLSSEQARTRQKQMAPVACSKVTTHLRLYGQGLTLHCSQCRAGTYQWL